MIVLLRLLTAFWLAMVSPTSFVHTHGRAPGSPTVRSVSGKRCRITRFGGKADARAGGVYSPCLKRFVRLSDIGIAIRGGRCFDRYEITNPRTGRRIVVPLIDFGPWLGTLKSCGRSLRCRLSKNGSRVMTKLRAGYWYQENCVDGTPEVLRLAGVKSLHFVLVRKVER